MQCAKRPRHVRDVHRRAEWTYDLRRIDDVNAIGGTAFTGSEAIVETAARNPVSMVEVFAGIASGSHTLSLWVRGISSPTCQDNEGNYIRSVLVEESAAFGAAVATPDQN